MKEGTRRTDIGMRHQERSRPYNTVSTKRNMIKVTKIPEGIQALKYK